MTITRHEEKCQFWWQAVGALHHSAMHLKRMDAWMRISKSPKPCLLLILFLLRILQCSAGWDVSTIFKDVVSPYSISIDAKQGRAATIRYAGMNSHA
jgi:hypothetical protein